MLRLLDLGESYLTDTNLDWLSGFSSLEYLDLSKTNLERATTSLQVLNKLTMLKEIHLGSCKLSTTLSTIFPSVVNASLVVVLDLSNNSLVGTIPDTFGNWTSLSDLDLTYNNLEGRIPDTFKNLMSITYLWLSSNNLQGGILDALWNITTLLSLDLFDNQLQGELPQSLGQFNLTPNLISLDLSGNMLSGKIPNFSSFLSLERLNLRLNMFNGTLPQSIGSLSSLWSLNLRSNHLEGLISEAHFFNLSSLGFLDLSFNSNLTVSISSSWDPPLQLGAVKLAHCNLGPYFPKWLKKLQLSVLDISSANISGTIPDWFWDTIPLCEHLNISNNHIYGFLPDLSSNLRLHIIDLSSNELKGSLPVLPPTTSSIDFSRNTFSGTITSVCNASNRITYLDLSNNLFSTKISQDCVRYLMSLYYLNLANNNFSGEIPTSVDLVCNVRSLHLSNNSFTGEISRSLENCVDLNILDLGENKFTGIIPGWLGESMPELAVLSLTTNKLQGSLPSTLCHLTKLQVLDISFNEISGNVSKCWKNFTILSSKLDSNSTDARFYKASPVAGIYDSTHITWKRIPTEYSTTLRLLTFIDLSSNNLTGEIPHEVTSLVGLMALNLSRNNLVGSIPHDIGKLDVLNFLDLSKNNLSGNIPSTLGQLSHLGVLDLSFNNFTGKIPWDDHLQTFGETTYIGNPGLCGPPLVRRPCPEDRTVPKMPPKIAGDLDDENVFLSWGFYFSIVFGFILAFWGVVLTAFLNKWCAFTLHKMVVRIEDWLCSRGFLSS